MKLVVESITPGTSTCTVQYSTVHFSGSTVQYSTVQYPPELLVGVSGEGVEVVPEAAGEEDGVLGDDGDGGAERGQAHLQYSTVQYSTA